MANLAHKYTLLLAAGGLVVVSGLALRGRREEFLDLIGAGQEIKYILFRILLAFVLTLFLYQFVESIPPKNGESGTGKTGSAS